MTKLPKSTLILLAILFAVFVVSAISVVLSVTSNRTAINQQQFSQLTPCSMGKSEQLSINSNKFEPSALTINRCDTLEITNNDGGEHQLTFGEHPNTESYPGYTAATLSKGESTIIQMIKQGTFNLHDHHNEKIAVTITVNP